MFYTCVQFFVGLLVMSMPLCAMNMPTSDSDRKRRISLEQMRDQSLNMVNFTCLGTLKQQLFKIKAAVEKYGKQQAKIVLLQQMQRELRGEIGILREKRAKSFINLLDIVPEYEDRVETIVGRRAIMPPEWIPGQYTSVGYDIWHLIASFLYGGKMNSSGLTIYSPLASTFCSRMVRIAHDPGSPRITAWELSPDGQRLLVGTDNGKVMQHNLIDDHKPINYQFGPDVEGHAIVSLSWARCGRWFGSSKNPAGIYFQGRYAQQLGVEESALNTMLLDNPLLEGADLEEALMQDYSPSVHTRSSDALRQFVVDKTGNLNIGTDLGVITRPLMRTRADPVTGEEIPEINPQTGESIPENIARIAVSHDGRAYMMINTEGTRFWFGRECATQGQGQQGGFDNTLFYGDAEPSLSPVDVSIDARGRYGATLHHGHVRVWQYLEHGREVAEKLLKLSRDEGQLFHGVAMTPEGSTLFTCFQDGVIRLHETLTGRCITVIQPQHMQYFGRNDQLQPSYIREIHTGMLLSGDGQTLVTYERQGKGHHVCSYQLPLFNSKYLERIDPRVVNIACGLLGAKSIVQSGRTKNALRKTLLCHVPPQDFDAMVKMYERGFERVRMCNFTTHIDELQLSSILLQHSPQHNVQEKRGEKRKSMTGGLPMQNSR